MPDNTDIEGNPIDAVITWVDGNDPFIQKKKNEILEKGFYSKKPVPVGRDNTRFTDNGEIQYCITSIRRFAPWIRHIHLVTYNQTPAFLTPRLRSSLGVKIVDHAEIFQDYEWAMPTFNSRTIETAIWRISDLSERFIYFNDDMFFLKEIEIGDFFRKDGVVCRGDWFRLKDQWLLYEEFMKAACFLSQKIMGFSGTMNLLQQMKSARLAGMTGKYYRTPHIPHPIRKQTLEKFFVKKPELFEKNIRYPFRDSAQFIVTYLAHHLEILNNSACLTPLGEEIMLSGERETANSLARKVGKLESGDSKFLCLQSYEKFSPVNRKLISSHLDSILDT